MIKRVIVLLSVLALLQGVEAKEEKIETEIGFYLTAEDRYSYEVRVSEGGYLLDGRQRITNGIVVYQLSVGEKKRFNLEAKEGYELEEIVINGKKIEEAKEIEIQGVSAWSVLEVQYRKKKEVTYLDTPKEIKEIVPTGDRIEIQVYLWMMLMMIYVSQRGIDTRKCEDIKKEEGGKEK